MVVGSTFLITLLVGNCGSLVGARGTKCAPVLIEISSNIECMKFLSESVILRLIEDVSNAFFLILIFI